jgi:3-oxoacyl-[acyl-carrier-protein] synthase-3
LHSEGKYADKLIVASPSIKHWVPEILESEEEDISYYPYMDGTFVFKHAVVRFSEVIMEGLTKNNLTNKDIDMFIPHQANLRIAQFIQKKFRLSDDQVFNNIMKYGNTTAASVIIALTEAWEEGRIKEGDNVVLAAFGSGFTWASAIIKW